MFAHLLGMRIIRATHPNIITVLTSKIEPEAKLPLAMIKGSPAQRNKLAKSYTAQLVEGLEKVSDKKQCKVSDFIGLINEIIHPAKININVKEVGKQWGFGTYKGGSIGPDVTYENNIKQIGNVVIESTHKNINGYEINLPLSKDKTIIKDKFTALHEARHLFDYICNPKTIDSKTLQVLDDEKKVEAFLGVHKEFVRDMNLLGGLRERAAEKLNQLSDNEAIDCLQYTRRTLKTEINAYSDALNYMRKYPVRNFFMINGNNEFMLTHNYPKRLKLANEMLAERIKQAREHNKTLRQT